MSAPTACTVDTEALTTSEDEDPTAGARTEVVGLKITGVFFLHDFMEVHMGTWFSPA